MERSFHAKIKISHRLWGSGLVPTNDKPLQNENKSLLLTADEISPLSPQHPITIRNSWARREGGSKEKNWLIGWKWAADQSKRTKNATNFSVSFARRGTETGNSVSAVSTLSLSLPFYLIIYKSSAVHNQLPQVIDHFALAALVPSVP